MHELCNTKVQNRSEHNPFLCLCVLPPKGLASTGVTCVDTELLQLVRLKDPLRVQVIEFLARDLLGHPQQVIRSG